MLIRGIFLIMIVLIASCFAEEESYSQEKRRIGLRLPNFLRYKGDQTNAIQKRRIGLRLPNMLKFRESGIDHQLDKRRMGMRLPNIIFLRNEKKNALYY